MADTARTIPRSSRSPDAVNAFSVPREEIKVLSIGVGMYNEPQRSVFHRFLFSRPIVRLAMKVLNANTKTIETLRTILFKDIACIRINDAFPDPQYATDLLEYDTVKLTKVTRARSGELRKTGDRAPDRVQLASRRRRGDTRHVMLESTPPIRGPREHLAEKFGRNENAAPLDLTRAA